MPTSFSSSNFVLLSQLSYSTVQNARKACGAHSALAREVNSLHVVLMRLESEASKPESILNSSTSDGGGVDDRKKELCDLVGDCERVLKVLKEILEKYNALSDEKRSVQKLWQRVQFGNGEMQDLDKIRSELATYTQAITLFLNLLGLGVQGKVEKYMESNGNELREIKASLNWVTAKLQVKEGATHGERSILSSYAGDDKEVWKIFRRELIQEGFSSRVLTTHKKTIKKYVMELGQRGVLDDEVPEEVGLEREDGETILESSAEAVPVKEVPKAPSILQALEESGTTIGMEKARDAEHDTRANDVEDDRRSSHQANEELESSDEESTSSRQSTIQNAPTPVPDQLDPQQIDYAARRLQLDNVSDLKSVNDNNTNVPEVVETSVRSSKMPYPKKSSQRTSLPSPTHPAPYTPIKSKPIITVLARPEPPDYQIRPKRSKPPSRPVPRNSGSGDEAIYYSYTPSSSADSYARPFPGGLSTPSVLDSSEAASGIAIIDSSSSYPVPSVTGSTDRSNYVQILGSYDAEGNRLSREDRADKPPRSYAKKVSRKELRAQHRQELRERRRQERADEALSLRLAALIEETAYASGLYGHCPQYIDRGKLDVTYTYD